MPEDPRIDSYIARQAGFARPILEHLRSAVHAACPGAEETMKWSMPFFLHDGRLLAGMAAFKAHARFTFWNSKGMAGGTEAEIEAMGRFDRLADMSDLPPDEILHALIRRAIALGDSGGRSGRAKAAAKSDPQTSAELEAALTANPRAKAAFDGFPPSARRDYVEWVGEAKRPETKARRIAQAVEWMAEGKRRNWKYEKC